MEKKDKKDSTPQVYNENHMENCNVFQGEVYGATFPLPGAQVTINQNYGKGQKPTQDVTSGKVETAEERDKRKLEVMRAITAGFDFSDEQLGYDNNHRKLTNDRIAALFRKCFGIGSYPSATNKTIMDQMWVLLIDKRDKCAKQGGEGFFRQTVLNVIGYYVSCGLISGLPLDLAQAVFKDADRNMAKNISRNMAVANPDSGIVSTLILSAACATPTAL
jgi:hypothetical protein